MLLKDLDVKDGELKDMIVDLINKGASQLNDLYTKLPYLVRSKRPNPPPDPNVFYSMQSERIEFPERRRVNDIVWDLVLEGKIRPGSLSGESPCLPFFHLRTIVD